MKPTKPEIEIKLIRHVFNAEECDDLGMQLARAHSALATIDGEFEQVKANFKSRIAEQEAILGRAASCRIAGYEMRSARCRVDYRPKEGKKDFYLEFAKPDDLPVLTEDMNGGDMQAHLIPDEPRFEAIEEIELWTSAADGPCVMKVGRLPANDGKKAMWFAALDARIEGQSIFETLESDQPCAIKRIDIIRRAAKRVKTWLIGAIGKEAAKGFDDAIDKAVDGQKEREE